MKRLIFISILAICISISKAEQCFFPANEIECINALVFKYTIDNGEYVAIEPDTIYYDVWCGNDTIFDGKECVTVWRKFGPNALDYGYHVTLNPGETELHAILYEDKGMVYINTFLQEGTPWILLYDFSDAERELGDSLYKYYDYNYQSIREVVSTLSYLTLENGEIVPVTNNLIYGIGYMDWAFLTPLHDISAYTPTYVPIKFSKNGICLYHLDQKQTSEIGRENIQFPSPYYDFMGRPVAHPTRGIYIKDGRKVILK